jgi:hypothetical protein
MSRKPVNTINALETRDAIWQAIRAFGGELFTLRQLQQETRCTISQTREYVTGLVNAGIIVDHGTTPRVLGNSPDNNEPFPRLGALRYYSLNRDTGPVAPRVRRDGTPVTQGQGRTNMWRVMRVLGKFNALELAVHASTEQHQVKPAEADKYCQFLARAGYLRRNGKTYQTISSRYSGPKPPMIQRIKQVYDPNLKTVVWSQGGDHDQD